MSSTHAHTEAFQAAYAHLNALLEGKEPDKDAAQSVVRKFKELEKATSAMTETPFPPAAPPLSGPLEALDEAVAQHLAREGMSKAANKLKEEAGVDVGSNLEAFEALGRICHALVDGRDCGPALEWCREQKADGCNELVFQLRSLQFMQLVEEGRDQQAALAFAQEHFSSVSESHVPSIQQLMGSLMFSNDLANSPYGALYRDDRYEVAARAVRAVFCDALDVPERSPLRVCAEAAAVVEPSVRRFRERVLRDADAQELPPVDLGRNLQFHSSLVCPITKEETSATNPPVRLVCGHVISRAAFDRIRTSRGRREFKCPYCPRYMARDMDPFVLNL